MTFLETVTWDWNNALGDTISEKYEAIYIFIAEQVKKITDNGYICLVCNERFGCVFEVVSGFVPAPASFTVNAIINYRGRVNSKYELWFDFWMPMDELIVCNDHEAIKIKIDNLVI